MGASPKDTGVNMKELPRAKARTGVNKINYNSIGLLTKNKTNIHESTLVQIMNE